MGKHEKPRPGGRVLSGGLPLRKFPTFSDETVAEATLNFSGLFYIDFGTLPSYLKLAGETRQCSPGDSARRAFPRKKANVEGTKGSVTALPARMRHFHHRQDSTTERYPTPFRSHRWIAVGKGPRRNQQSWKRLARGQPGTPPGP